MSDLVERLRAWADDDGPGPFSHHRRIQEEAADEITRLRDESKTLQYAATLLADERNSLRAEVEALRADAERWRWLRDTDDAMSRLTAAYWNTTTQVDFDAAIDAARKA